MKTLKIIVVFFILMSIKAEAQWAEVNSPGVPFTDIAVISEDTCYGIVESASWDNNMYKTFDGGNTWSSVTVNVDTNFMMDHNVIQFITQDTGFVAGRADVNGGWFAGGYSAGRIYKTVDGGVSWSDISPPEFPDSSIGIYNMYFFNESTGLAFEGTGYGSVRIWKTTDGGVSWTSKTLPTLNLSNVSFNQNGQGYVAGSGTSSGFYSQGIVVFTNDFGSTWSYNALNNPNTRIGAVERIDQNTVYALSKVGGKLFKSFDNGSTWDTTYLPMEAYNMHFFTKTNGFLIGEGDTTSAIYSTMDGGQNWNLELTLSKSGISGMKFNEVAGYIHGQWTNAILAKYTDDGVISSTTEANVPFNTFSEGILGIYPNPAESRLHVQFDVMNITSNLKFTITDMTGKVVNSYVVNDVGSGSYVIDISSVRSGQYILQMQNNEQVLDNRKIVIAH